MITSLLADLRRDGCTRMTVLPRILLAPRTQALVLFRLSQLRPNSLGLVFRRINYTLNGCDLAPSATIGPGLRLPHPVGVVIGPDVIVGANCTLAQGTTLGMGATGSPTIEEGAVIGAGAVIFGDVTIGRQARIGANSVVLKDVAAGMIAAGAPAKEIARWSGVKD